LGSASKKSFQDQWVSGTSVMASSPLKRSRQYAFNPDDLGKRHPIPMIATGNWRGILFLVCFNDKL
jgi:hypothetical protein